MKILNMAAACLLLFCGLFGCAKEPMEGDTRNESLEADVREAGREAGDAAETAGDKLDSAGTTAAVKTALLGDTEVGALEINVDTEGTTVYLRGEVESQAQKYKAEIIALRTAGREYEVVNELRVEK